jgi:hypothetical protein
MKILYSALVLLFRMVQADINPEDNVLADLAKGVAKNDQIQICSSIKDF